MGTAYEIAMSRSMRGSAHQGFDLMKDVERFPEFMPNVRSVGLMEDGGSRKVAAWEIELDGAPLRWVEEGVYDQGALRIDFRALEGVFDRFDGHWTVTPDGDGCRIAFGLTYEIGLPEIEHLLAPILRERMEENARDMLTSIEARLAGEPGQP